MYYIACTGSNLVNTILRCLLAPRVTLRQIFFSILFITLTVTGNTASSDQKILIAYHKSHMGSQSFSQQLIDSLHKNIKKSGYQVQRVMLNSDNLRELKPEKHHLIVAIGSNATKTLLEANIKTPILSTLMPRHIAVALRHHYPKRKNWSNLLLDQPIERQFHLITSIMGKHQKTGVIMGPYTKDLKKTLKRSAKISNHILATEYVDSPDLLTRSLKTLTKETNILLTLPDPVIYNKNTIRGILLQSYRRKLPIIGFSRAYVKAGAIAAIYSQPFQISNQTVEIIQDYFKHNYFKHGEYHPHDFSISLNDKVAHSLGINLPEESTIIEKIKMAEKKK